MSEVFQPQKTISKLEKIRKEIGDTIAQLKKSFPERKHYRPICKNCSVLNVRLRMDKSYHCRTCGYDSKEVEEDEA